jgi:large subunit ribosomal protein L5
MSEKEKSKKPASEKTEHKKAPAEHKAEHKKEASAHEGAGAHHEHKPEHKAAEHKKEGAAHEGAPKEKAKKEAQPKEKRVPSEKYTPRLKSFYQNDVIKQMIAEYKYKSPMAIPRLEKVVINIGVGKETIEKKDPGVVDSAQEELTLIAGQKAVKTYSKKAISNFHLREGLAIGAKVNIRGNRMYDFVDKLISVALPRVRDFKGLSTSSFDGRGNYTIGLKEQLVFPEINYDKVKKVRGMDVTIVTSAKNDEESLKLLKALGFPFKDKDK